MIKYENECVGCPTEMGCLGSSCPHRNVLHIYCDNCGNELNTDIEDDEYDVYMYNNKHLCLDCLLDETGANRFCALMD